MRVLLPLIVVLLAGCAMADPESPQIAACVDRAQASSDPPGKTVVNAVAGDRQPDGEVVRLYWAPNGDLSDRGDVHVFDCVMNGTRIVRAGTVDPKQVVLPIVRGTPATSSQGAGAAAP
jgi:hypothetical protein